MATDDPPLTPRLTCELVTDFARLERLAPEWRRLHDEAPPAGGVFQTWGWTRAYWTTHGLGLSLCTPVVFAGDRVVGILPLALRGHVARPLGSPYSDYTGVLCRPDLAGAVVATALAALLDGPLPWQECVLEGVPDASSLVQAGASLPARLRAHQQAVFGTVCPVAVNDTGDVFDRMSRKESLRRHEKRLRRRGDLRFRHIEDRAEILARMDEFLEFQVTRHAMGGVRSAFVAPDARAMLEALVRELDPARDMRFSVLELRDRAVAYHLGFECAGRFTYYVPAFDIDCWDGGPGEVLLRHLLVYAHERRLEEFDFTVGDEAYKSRFATDVRRTHTVYFYRRPFLPAVEIRRASRGVRGAARRSPRVLAWARAVSRQAARSKEWLRRFRVPAQASALRDFVFSRGEMVVGHRTAPARPAPGARVIRLSLKDMAWRQIQQDHALDPKALDDMRRCLARGGALYLASADGAHCIFKVSPVATDGSRRAEGRASVVLAEAPAPARCGDAEFGGLLGAMLDALDGAGDVCISEAHHSDVAGVLERSGYTVTHRWRRTALLGRTRLSQPPGSSPPAIAQFHA